MRNKLIGFFLAMIGMWGGCYFLSLGTIYDWWHIPTFITSFGLFFGGVTLCMYGDV